MKKTFAASLVFLSLLCALSTSAHAGKMDLPLKMLVGEPSAGKALLGKAVSIRAGVEHVDVLIKSSDPDITAADIEAEGGEVRAIIGDIMTALVPVGLLAELEARDEVKAIEAAKELRPLMDSARANTKVDRLQDGSADGTSWSGKNVVVGAVDSGLDYSLNDFKDADGDTRVQYLRFQSVSSGTVSITECTKSKVGDGTCSISADNDSLIGHGTHVTGIAAGSDSTYKGVAPAADIMFVRSSFSDDLTEGSASFSSTLLEGVDAIFEKSDDIDKPAVINISMGTHIGAHDDTSLMEQGLDNAVNGLYAANGKSYGRAVVAAAGNEHVIYDALPGLATYAGGIHSSFSVSSGASNGWRLWVLGEPTRSPLVIDIWFGSGQKDSCSVAAKVYDYTKLLSQSLTTASAQAPVGDVPLSTDNSGTSAASTDGKVTINISADSADSQNSKPRAIAQFGPTSTFTSGGAGSWSDIILGDANDDGVIDSGRFLDVIIRASGGACSGDFWLEGGGTVAHFMKGIDTGAYNVTGTGAYSMQAGDNNRSVGLPATASGVIAVGAYLQEKPYGSGGSRWTDINGTVHDATDVAGEPAAANVNGSVDGLAGSRSSFSSIGPPAYSYSGRKPDILAPGDPIISARASGYTPTYVDNSGQTVTNNSLIISSGFVKMQGTSQASPHIAGIIALLFQKNNTLTAAQAKNALISTAGLASSPNDSDGYGNVDAVAAMAAIAADTSGYSGTGDLNGGTTTSAGGCGGAIMPASAANAGALPIALLLLPGILIAIRRRE